MEFNVGDKVRFLNEVGEGKVVKILSEKMLMICDKDGFEYQMPTKELIILEKVQNFSQAIPNILKENENKEIKNDVISDFEWKKEDTTNIFLAFSKKEDDNNFIEVFLINDSNFFVFYNFLLKLDLGFEQIDADILEPNTKIFVTEFSIDKINHTKEIILQLTFYGHKYKIYSPQIEKNIKIVPLNFWQEFRYIENDFIDTNAYVIDIITENQLVNKVKSKEKEIALEDKINNIIEKDLIPEEDNSRKFAPRKQKETIELDLHITSLLDSVVGLSNSEMVEIQMKAFHKAMTDAITNKNVSKLILIHGIGAGTLKNMVRESISKQYKLKFEDASYREYGFGATMVIF